ncbi:MAG: SDR family oxidoreductase [Hyphomicrobiales bacterium]|nr:SDR family oxidoreductase [Hyphomicrobiales bacterium]MCP5371170.1 SDR family oxidoreductase [Hyphomicrobiales bacterium]
MRLQDKVAVITGAGSGFGEGIARKFVAEGAKVVIADINEEAAERVAGDLAGAAIAVRADVSDGTQVAAMVRAAVDGFGGLDIVVNNAGYTHLNMPLTEVTEADFDRVYAVNVKSVYWSAVHAVPVFRAHGGGVILNIASTAGVRPRPGLTWYNSSKGAVITMTKSMAVELAPDGIRVCALNPVAGDTPMLARFMGEDTEEKRALFRSSIPLGRLSTPRDMGNAAAFLCSDEADMLTGVCLEVDGGRCI